MKDNNMINKKTINLSEKVIVSDPSYNLNKWGQIVLDNVLPGEYNCYLKFNKNNNRVSNIYIFHENYEINPESIISEYIRVDSGKAGFFDYYFYEGIKLSKEQNKIFYDKVCNLTTIKTKNLNYSSFFDTDWYLERYIRAFEYIDLSEKFKKELEEVIKNDTKPSDELNKYVILLANDSYKQSIESILFISDEDGDIIENKGFVSSSGYGDGLYTLYAGYNSEKQIVSMKIKFI